MKSNNWFNLTNTAYLQVNQMLGRRFAQKGNKLERSELVTNLEKALSTFKEIQNFKIHGSLSSNKFDQFSDVDLQIDVSGFDNGKFMLDFVKKITNNLEVGYVAFAPRFVPELYLATVYFKNTDIFHFVDFEFIATPHIQNITKEYILSLPEIKNTKFKLLLNCLKSHLRKNPDNSFLFQFVSGSDVDRPEISVTEKLRYSFDKFLNDENQVIQNCAKIALNLISEKLCLTTCST